MTSSEILSPDKAAEIPELRGDIRHLIPKLGLKEYWYPAVNASEVGTKKPKQVRMLGTDLCFFRDKKGEVVALNDVCPHRGGILSEGDCHFKGFVTCPYHAWTFDGEGKNVAILTEGLDSKICGTPGTEARKYPTQTIRGVVFIWMGDGAAAPIEEDVPQDFFEEDVYMLHKANHWDANWNVALENALDSHVSYVHMNAWRAILAGNWGRLGGAGLEPVWTGNGIAGGAKLPPFRQTYYPQLGGSWPKSNYRNKWGKLFKGLLGFWIKREKRLNPKWVGGYHLPGMLRGVNSHYYRTRWPVPVDEHTSRVWYFWGWPVQKPWDKWIIGLQAKLYINWLDEGQFSRQDYSVMPNLRYDQPETLSPHDLGVVLWRQLVATKALGGRNAPFRFRGRSLVGNEGLDASSSVTTTSRTGAAAGAVATSME